MFNYEPKLIKERSDDVITAKKVKYLIFQRFFPVK